MRTMGNTLYVTTPEAYLSLDGENVVVLKEQEQLGRIPLHNLEGIVTFGYAGASPALMAACAQRQVALTFLSAHGRFLCRVTGEVQGNVLLRKKQYHISESEGESALATKPILLGKIYNARWVLERAIRDYALRLDTDRIGKASAFLQQSLSRIRDAQILEELRGIEGEAAARYFSVLDELILQQKMDFFFHGRNKRPPLDNMNAMLSFVYTLLAHDVAAALQAVGLDPYVGFLHRDRPGRISLALDMMEELRPILADRFVLSLVNLRQVSPGGFNVRENGAVVMDDTTRKTILTAWQQKKQEIITHPFLEEKLPWGLVAHSQAMLLARFLRGDLDGYPPFLWK